MSGGLQGELQTLYRASCHGNGQAFDCLRLLIAMIQSCLAITLQPSSFSSLRVTGGTVHEPPLCPSSRKIIVEKCRSEFHVPSLFLVLPAWIGYPQFHCIGSLSLSLSLRFVDRIECPFQCKWKACTHWGSCKPALHLDKGFKVCGLLLMCMVISLVLEFFFVFIFYFIFPFSFFFSFISIHIGCFVESHCTLDVLYEGQFPIRHDPLLYSESMDSAVAIICCKQHLGTSSK